MFKLKPYSQPPWWDRELENLKNEKYQALRAHRDHKTDINLFRELPSKFKKTFSTKRQFYQDEQKQRLID